MISFSEALEQIRAVANIKRENFQQEKEQISLEPAHAQNAVRRFLSDDLHCTRPIPAFSNSAMDGFAVRSSELLGLSKSGTLELPVVDTIFAGDTRDVNRNYPAFAAVEIMTGAPLPSSFDAVVKVEETTFFQKTAEVNFQNWVRFECTPSKNEFVRKQGSDYQKGDRLARQSTCLHPELILALASASLANVSVYRKIRVGILSTGSELYSRLDDGPTPGQIPNSTAPYLAAALNEYGCEVIYLGAHPDDGKSFSGALQELCRAHRPDLIVTTGAVSKGKLDFVPSAILSTGADIHFHGVSIKPGKPLLFASFKDPKMPAIFSVPGNPVSTVVALRFFISAYLAELLGHGPEKGIRARLTDPVLKPKALHCFWKSHLHPGLGGTEITVLEGQESYRVSSLIRANAWSLFAEGEDEIRAGNSVLTYDLRPEFLVEEHHTKDCC